LFHLTTTQQLTTHHQLFQLSQFAPQGSVRCCQLLPGLDLLLTTQLSSGRDQLQAAGAAAAAAAAVAAAACFRKCLDLLFTAQLGSRGDQLQAAAAPASGIDNNQWQQA
jgi:hypothetical protein